MDDECNAPTDGANPELTVLVRWLTDMGWEPGENSLTNVAGSLALSRILTARSMRFSLATLERIPEKEIVHRRLLNSLLDGELATIDAVERTFSTILKPEYASGAEIGKVFRGHMRRSRYAAQYTAASKCFGIMKDRGFSFERVPHVHRLTLKLAMRADFVGRLTTEELSREDFDRELVEIANNDSVQSELYTAGPKRAAGVFLAIAVGVPESTGRSWLTKHANEQTLQPSRSRGPGREQKPPASVRVRGARRRRKSGA